MISLFWFTFQLLTLVIVANTSNTFSEINNQKDYSAYKKISKINGPWTKDELTEMQIEAAKAFEVISGGLKTKKSTANDFLESKKDDHTDGFICKTCLWSMTHFHNLLEKKYGLSLFNYFLTLLCRIGVDKTVCQEAINLYSPVIIDSIIEHYLDAEYICTLTYICRFSHFRELNPDEYARELLKDKPSKEEIMTRNAKNKIFGQKKLKVLHVTDIHTDLNYIEVN